MKVKLFGVRKMDFTSSKGETIKGLKLYIGYCENGVEGFVTDSLFVPENKTDMLAINPSEFIAKDIYIDFDIKGKAQSVSG